MDGRNWPQGIRERIVGPLLPSAVLIPIIERKEGLTVLLTVRAAHLKHHPGQISFPGGRMERTDRDLAETALRETHEEVGVAPGQVAVAGYLAPLPTVTGYVVTPIVGLLDPDAKLSLDHREVSAAFEVPLEFLLDQRNQEHSLRQYLGIRIPVIAYRFETRHIWGATAAMIDSLQKQLLIK
ncbi:MAG: CoA pyrophosphatase [Halioglobus sp.]|nr:CoA pyrophosphatase [Halioglobus sp.]